MGEPTGRHEHGGQWRNWAGDEGCRPRAIERPGSVQEIVAALERARREGCRVRTVGSGHSFSDIACSDGMVISLQGMQSVLDIDRHSGLVRVQGGIAIGQLSARLAEHGLALENLGDVDVQSIAGAISTATHGTGARLRNISAQVVELTLVLADGSTLACSQERDPDVLRAARVGLGALGIVAEATLRCVPAFTLRGVDAPAPLVQTLERFDELAERNDHFEFFVFPHCDTALTRTNNRTDEPPRPRGKLAAYTNDVLLANHAFGAFCALGRTLPGQIPRINRLVTKLAGTSRRVDRSDRIFASPRLVRFTEMEYALPRERTAEAVRSVMDLVRRRGFAVPFPIEVRTVAGDDAMLSTAYGRDSGYVAVHMYKEMEWRPYFEAVEEIMVGLGGRPHWGKRHFRTAAELRGSYPEWDRFQAIRARLDPDGLFANAWTDRVLGPVACPPPTRSPASDGASHKRFARMSTADLLERLERATAELDPPFAVVDMDAFWSNAADMEGRAGGKPIRLASKSVRCRSLQERVLSLAGFAGTLAFTLPEALWLAEQGFDDIVVAYPTADHAALRALADLRAGRPELRLAVMVDSAAQLDLIEAAADRGAHAASPGQGSTGSGDAVEVCIDLDAGLWMFGGRVKVGAKRSPVHTAEQAAALAREIVARPGVSLVGMMAYEAQIAGVGDAPTGRRLRGAAIRALQRRSARELVLRRAEAVAAVGDVLGAAGAPPLRFVNGGGTGSIELTASEPAITEVAAGSGLYGPALFDGYRAFALEPAALFALPVVRKPSAGVATVLGGGYLASGPADAARLPVPFLPRGLRLDRQEGAGEVQTPLLGRAARDLRVGDRVWLRDPKAGELCERFDRLHLIEGERVVGVVPTYRGEGKCFL